MLQAYKVLFSGLFFYFKQSPCFFPMLTASRINRLITHERLLGAGGTLVVVSTF